MNPFRLSECLDDEKLMNRLTLEKHRVGSFLARRLPKPVVDLGGWALACVLASGHSNRRLLVERNLRRAGVDAFEDLPGAVRKAFASYAKYYVDSSVVARLSPSQVDAGFTFESFENILDAHRKGPGPILALPHVGSWDWAGAWLAQVPGYPVTVVVESVEPKELFDWMAEYRRRLGLHVLPATPGVMPKLSLALEEGHVICLLCDRNVGSGGVEVEFFGETTKLPAGAALLARRSGAGIVPAVVYNLKGKCHAVTRPAIYVEQEGSLRAVIQETTQALACELEEMIRAAPTQWHMMQPNWPSDRALEEMTDCRVSGG